MEVIFQNNQIKWINLNNPSHEELINISEEYNFSNLMLEDSLEPGHLPKFEVNEEISFLLIRYFENENRPLKNIVREFSHKTSIFFGKNFILTVHNNAPYIINQTMKNYIQLSDSSKITKKGIIYHLISETLKTYEKPAIRMDEEIDNLEELIFTNDIDKLKLHTLYHLKREASACKKILDYTLDALKDYGLIYSKTSSLQDLKEDNIKMLHFHTQIVEDVQNLLSIYLSINSQKSNEIMKTLTIFSAFFLPLTFIVGVYGMNFDYMPELHYKLAYPISLIVMVTIVVVIFLWFKRKKFL